MYRVVWPDGSVHVIEAIARVIRDAAGSVVRVSGINRDITTEHEAVEALRTANRRLGLATSGGGIGVWEWNLRENTQWWDEQMYRLYRTPEGFVGGYAWWESVVHPEDLGRAVEQLQRCLATPGLDYDAEFRVQWPDGEWRTLRSRAVITRDADGEPLAMIGVNFDVTEHRALQSALVEANQGLEARVAERTRQLEVALNAAEAASRAKSEFLANMSHELRTPLHGILGFAKLLAEEGPAPQVETVHRYAAYVVKNGTQLLALVDDLLDSAKIEVGNFRVQPEPGDLAAVVAAVVDEFAGRSRSDVSLRLDRPAALPLRIDGKRIAQVVRNLVANAVRLSPQNGEVRVRVGLAANGEARVEVLDEGPGVPEAELEAIFERFIQGSKTKTGAGGAGLGLAIARSIAQLHGGRLVAANRPGGGAVFILTLPLTLPQGDGAAPPDSSSPGAITA